MDSMMLYNDLQEIATRVGSYAITLYSLDKLGLNELINQNDSSEILSLKVAGLLSGTEYISDYALEKVGFRAPTKFSSDMGQFIKNFISNAAVYYVMDKMNIDDIFYQYSTTPERRAVMLAVVFALVNEISNKLITMWGL